MTLPPALRYRLVRLKSISRQLRRPMVWGSLATLGLLAVVVPQYLHHPEWHSRYDPATDSPAVTPGTDLGTLSNEDLADLAEIDNLALLLRQIQPTTAATLDLPAADSDRLDLPQATPNDEDTTSPFAQYLERSRFRFNPAATGTTVEGESAIAPGTIQPFTSTPSSGALQPSPLQQALNGGLNARSGQSPRVEARSEIRGIAEEPAATSGLTPQPWMVEGNVPGVDQRFIRTTPQMSPPPGTTGYALPPSLSSPSVTAAPASPLQGATAPAALNLDFGSPVAAPAGIQPGPSSPSAIAPTVPSDPLPQPAPAPFSAPRPPGVYTGGGYINTFANPSGPVD